jgi:hypothetical protein
MHASEIVIETKSRSIAGDGRDGRKGDIESKAHANPEDDRWPLDPDTIERLKAYSADIERQFADIEAREADGPPESCVRRPYGNGQPSIAT